jgi:DNA-binding NtrC family response regulator
VTYVTPLRYGSAPVIEFLRQLRPDVVVYTVALPFRESWAEFQRLRAAVPSIDYVLTTTNKEALDEIVGPTEAFEIIGKPFDIDQVVAAVRRALDARWHG